MKIKIPSICLMLLTGLYPLASQAQQNYGLTAPQDVSGLPVSKEPFISPLTVVKKNIAGKLVAHSLNDWIIAAGWELSAAVAVNAESATISRIDFNTANWYNAFVPGTVLTSLVKQGVYADPYFGLNNLSIPDTLCRQAWWYRVKFKAPARGSKKAWLVLNGINYKAVIWLNGQRLGDMHGAFVKGRFDVSTLLEASKENVVAVQILPPPHPGIPHEQSPGAGRGPNGGALCLDGPTFIASEGWDWMPGIRDRNIGIWQDVHLEYSGPVTLKDVQVITDLPLPDTSRAAITIHATAQNNTAVFQQVTVQGKIGAISFNRKVNLQAGETKSLSFTPKDFKDLNINHPRLWWPNGYGNPALYQLVLTVRELNGTASDAENISFGIRELSYDMTVDVPGNLAKRVVFNPLVTETPILDNINRREISGVSIASLKPGANADLLPASIDTGTAPYLVINVNGKRIFCRGGNWGMDDAMKNVSREHLEPYFKLHQGAHFNMVRNWTGECTEEMFYTLCDEYGMLVWNDFWMSTGGYNLDPANNQLFINNAREVVRRFRNHPSIAIWCPRNEGYAPVSLEDSLALLIATEDGTRYYQPNSRYFNLRGSGPWHYLKNPQQYYELAHGFNTEFGTPSIPTSRSILNMMAAKDAWPVSDAWYYHDLHFGQKEYLHTIDSLYGSSDNLPDFCKKAQLVNYESHRLMFEAWNSRMWNNTTGLLLWMSHPAWPSMVWQTYSWDYETFGAYFGSMKACEPLHIQLQLNTRQVMVVNSTLNSFDRCNINSSVYDIDGRLIAKQDTIANIKANGLTNLFYLPDLSDVKGVYLVRLTIKKADGSVYAVNDYWQQGNGTVNYSAFNQVEKASIAIQQTQSNKKHPGQYHFSISNQSATPAIAIKLNAVAVHSGQLILPAYFSDGYFNLLPGETRSIDLTIPKSQTGFTILAEAYNGGCNSSVIR